MKRNGVVEGERYNEARKGRATGRDKGGEGEKRVALNTPVQRQQGDKKGNACGKGHKQKKKIRKWV